MANPELGIGTDASEIKAVLSKQDLRSVYILQALQNCDWFRLKNRMVRLYNRNQERALVPTNESFSIKDFFNAVDYYYDNRVSEEAVNRAMMKPEGKVEVFSPHVPKSDEPRKIVVSIKNYMVPQILEFAYLLARNVKSK